MACYYGNLIFGNRYALIYILPDHRQLTKKKTRVALRTCDPEWDMYWEVCVVWELIAGEINYPRLT